MSPLEWARKESALLARHPWEFATCTALAIGIGFAAADFHYSGRIDALMETLQTKDFPKPPPPVTKTVYVPTPDPAQSARIVELEGEVDQLKHKPPAKAAPPAPSVGPVTGQGNIVAPGMTGGSNTLNNFLGKPVRHLTDGDKAELLRTLPISRPVTVGAINDSEAKDYAVEIFNFLKRSGYTVDGVNTNLYAGPDPKGANINTNPDHLDKPIEIVVGANVVPNSP